MSRRSAPRRAVEEVWRTGDYATTLWHHRLECGHVESRKRRAPATEIGCLRCEAASEVDVQAMKLVDVFRELELDTAVLRARIAAGVTVPPDAVILQYDGGRIAGALIVLDARQVSEIAKA